MIELNVEIGARLRQFREGLDISQRQFSRMLNINPSNWSRIERGILPLNPIYMNILLEQFQISIDWLFTGEGEKSAPKQDKQKNSSNFISDNKEVQELEKFLRTFPWFKNELKLSMKKYYKENREALDEEAKAFLRRFTREGKK